MEDGGPTPVYRVLDLYSPDYTATSNAIAEAGDLVAAAAETATEALSSHLPKFLRRSSSSWDRHPCVRSVSLRAFGSVV